MKNILFILLLIFGASSIQAQGISDALRYSSEELSGTARFTAMSGAFGALGGDFSALKINPAGSAVFLYTQAALTLNFRDFENTTRFRNGTHTNSKNKLHLNQAGIVFVFNNHSENTLLQKLTFGFTYDQINNFNGQIFAYGNSGMSINDYFVDRAQGVPLDLFVPLNSETLADLYAYLGTASLPTNYRFGNTGLQTAYLGYETFLFDADDPNDFANTAYTPNVSGNSFHQEYSQTATGLNGKYTLNAGAQLGNNLFLGFNLNNHLINYERVTGFYETNQDPGSSINEIYFENTLSTIGHGISLQVGAIYRFNHFLRLGASYTSPTWYNITEKTTQYLDSYSNQLGSASADPRITNVFPEYKLRTPSKLTGSLGLVFGQSGLISFDYSYQDFSNIELGSEYGDHVFDAQNTVIKNNLQAVSSFRIGGEYRLKDWSLRAGYRMKGSPYKDEAIMSDLKGYSFGFGYDFGSLALDFAYSQSNRDYDQRLYQTGISTLASIDHSVSNYTFTLSFGL